MVERQSSRCQSGYLLASAGVGESSTDLVYGGHIVIGENGALLENGQASRFQRKNSLITAEIDMENLQQIRLRNKSFAQQQGLTLHGETYVRIPISNRCDPPDILLPIQRFVRQKPFEPEEPQALAEHCQEILSIQTTALAKRLTSFNYSQIKLPISMDFNTLLAMIVAGETQRLLPQDRPQIVGIYSDSLSSEIMTYLKQFSKAFGISLVTDVLDQNNQAQLKILQLNSQNMSEAAIGQLHFTEKPQDIYCLNIGLPYTLVQQMVAWAENQLYQGVAAKALQMLLKEARQTSLNLLTGQAPYQVLDFYLYYTLKFGTPPAKLLYLAEQAFAAEFTSAKLKKWLRLFYENFFTCQAQRSATPDGPKALDISLSPRVGLHWPSDASDMAWRAWFDTNA
jgi:NAD+ synthase (glutamine-hydrolysing)